MSERTEGKTVKRRGSRFITSIVLFVLAGHFVGLLTPASVYHHVISTENKQLLAMVSGGFFGQRSLAIQPPTAHATASTSVPITAPIAPPLLFFASSFSFIGLFLC